MQIVVDRREQTPLDFSSYQCTVTWATLPTGDYSLQGMEHAICLERKSLGDLVGCLMGHNRERFEAELVRGRGYDVFAVIVEANWHDLTTGQYRSRMNPHAAAQSVLAFQVRYHVPFIFAGSRDAAAYIAYWIFDKYLIDQRRRYEAILCNAGDDVHAGGGRGRSRSSAPAPAGAPS